ncbi:hypothetical protein U1Q18_009518 [Sarracenia purpurea var. burkii]
MEKDIHNYEFDECQTDISRLKYREYAYILTDITMLENKRSVVRGNSLKCCIAGKKQRIRSQLRYDKAIGKERRLAIEAFLSREICLVRSNKFSGLQLGRSELLVVSI